MIYKKSLPVIEPGKSDSASFDNALEMLFVSRALAAPRPHDAHTRIVERQEPDIPEELKYFYEYHSTFMEPWDGPASMVFCDGRYVGGTLDRNGLRPSRYVVTKDDLIVMGSEVGVQTSRRRQIAYKGRLMPGKLLLVDMEEGRIIPDEEIKHSISTPETVPATGWSKNRINLEDLDVKGDAPVAHGRRSSSTRLHLLHGYTREDIEDIISAHGGNGTGADRLHGDRHAPGGLFRQAPAAVQLFQAVLRPGDQPAHRPDPRRAGHDAHQLYRARRRTCSTKRPSTAA